MDHLEEEVTLDIPAITDPLFLSLKWEGDVGFPERLVLAAWSH